MSIATLARWSLPTVAALFLFTTGATAQQNERPLFVPGEIIVKFKEEVGPVAIRNVLASNGLQVIRELPGIDALHSALPDGLDPKAAKALLESLPQVLYAEPNFVRYADAVPNDPLFSDLWGLHNIGQTGGSPDADIDAPEAWDIETGSPNVIVAVIDSGTDIFHEDLAANIFINPGELSGNGIDDDGNGFIDDVAGWDFFDNDNNPRDNSPACAGHGTHTAGTVGAVGNNAIGVTGVAQTTSILPIRVLGPFLIFCAANDADIIAGINYAAIMGAHISNNSYGGGGFSSAVRDAIAAARHLYVAAAGNDGMNNDSTPSYPASYDLDNIVAVAATDDDDLLAFFSNYGVNSVDLAAPGVNILSTLTLDRYGFMSGTSMATPHVAGAAAVLLSDDPGLTVAELKDRLLRGVDSLGLPLITGGGLNLNNSLLLPDSGLTVTLTPLGPTTVLPGDVIEFTAAVQNATGSVKAVEASVRAWLPSGNEVTIVSPINVNVPAGGTLQTNVSQPIPITAPAGDYFVIGRVSNGSNILEETLIVYTVN